MDINIQNQFQNQDEETNQHLEKVRKIFSDERKRQLRDGSFVNNTKDNFDQYVDDSDNDENDQNVKSCTNNFKVENLLALFDKIFVDNNFQKDNNIKLKMQEKKSEKLKSVTSQLKLNVCRRKLNCACVEKKCDCNCDEDEYYTFESCSGNLNSCNYSIHMGCSTKMPKEITNFCKNNNVKKNLKKNKNNNINNNISINIHDEYMLRFFIISDNEDENIIFDIYKLNDDHHTLDQYHLELHHQTSNNQTSIKIPISELSIKDNSIDILINYMNYDYDL